jgi:hypothetical protein
MNTLAKLKLVASKPQRHQTPVQARRNKLSAKLYEQIQLATAKNEGRSYTPTKWRTYTNKETGERKTVELPKRIKEWWWTNDGGTINVSVRYGARQIELAKGKNAIEVANIDVLVTALTVIKTAVENGELDSQIEAASTAVRKAFVAR